MRGGSGSHKGTVLVAVSFIAPQEFPSAAGTREIKNVQVGNAVLPDIVVGHGQLPAVKCKNPSRSGSLRVIRALGRSITPTAV
jgi:hypothetical protein